MSRRGLLVASLCVSAAALSGCASAKKAAPVEAIEYGELAERYNERTQLLGVLRGRGVVNFRWHDAKGIEHWEQGNLDIQIAQPSRVVFRVHKLGETYLWVGCDEERYWMIDLLRDEETVAYVGRHDALTDEKARQIGLLVPPRELITLMGVRSLPMAGEAHEEAPEVMTTEEGWRVVLPALHGAQWVYEIDAIDARPTAIELVGADEETAVKATLSDYLAIHLTGNAALTHLAMQVDIAYPAAGATMRIDMDSVNDRAPKDSAFDFERLIEILRPKQVIDLDAVEVGVQE